MCGRCRCSIRPDDLPRACHRRDTSVRHVDVDRFQPRFNVSPGSYFPVLRRENGGDEGFTAAVHCMKWGLIPSFTKKDEKPDHYRMFNARSESIGEKASFRRLIPKNRCLVAVEGFYEWKKGPKKQPYYIHLKDGRPLVFAALYDSWKNTEEKTPKNPALVFLPKDGNSSFAMGSGEILYTFTILTTESSPALQWLHDRMPVILGDEASTDAWFNCPSDAKSHPMLKPYEKSDLVWYPVSSAMNKASFDGPECIKEIPLKEQKSNPITKFFAKKGTGDDKDTNDGVKSSLKESTPTDLKSNVKEELEEQDSLQSSSSTLKSDSEAKFDVSAYTPKSEIKVEGKRDLEEFLTDAKPNTDEVVKPPQTSVKKIKVKSGTEKKGTIQSFFAKSS